MKKNIAYIAAFAVAATAALFTFSSFADAESPEQQIENMYMELEKTFLDEQDKLCREKAMGMAMEEFQAMQNAPTEEGETTTTTRQPKPVKPQTGNQQPAPEQPQTNPTPTTPKDGATGTRRSTANENATSTGGRRSTTESEATSTGGRRKN